MDKIRQLTLKYGNLVDVVVTPYRQAQAEIDEAQAEIDELVDMLKYLANEHEIWTDALEKLIAKHEEKE